MNVKCLLQRRRIWRWSLVGLGLLTGCRAVELQWPLGEESPSPSQSPTSSPSPSPSPTPSLCDLCAEYDVLLGGDCVCSRPLGVDTLTPLPSGSLKVGVVGSHKDVVLTLTGRGISLVGIEGPALNVLTGNERQSVLTLEDCRECSVQRLTLTRGGANEEPGSGGAGLLVNNSTDVRVDTVWLLENTALSTASKGGGILVRDSNVTLSQVVVVGNKATLGGGLALDEKVEVTAEYLWLSGNHADADGGGIWLNQGASLDLTYGLLENNTASEGAAIHLVQEVARTDPANAMLVRTVLIPSEVTIGDEVDGYGTAQLSVLDSIWMSSTVDCPEGVSWRFERTFMDGNPGDCTLSPAPIPLNEAPFLPDDLCYHLREDSPALLEGQQTGLYSDEPASGWDLDGDGTPVWSSVGAYSPAEGVESCEIPRTR